VPSLTNCERHPKERVRSYCSDCKLSLCPECIIDHARHDFIAANRDAAILVKSELAILHSKIEAKKIVEQNLVDQVAANKL
jgi:hypothetical protein